MFMGFSSARQADIIWRNSDVNCFEGLDIDNREFNWESFILQDLDGDDFPEVILYSSPLFNMDEPPEQRLYRNRGDFENPDWIRDDDLFFQIIGDVADWNWIIPQFCDWDGNGRIDFMLGTGDGFARLERDDEGNWEDYGFVDGLVSGDIANRFADFNGDGVLDIV